MAAASDQEIAREVRELRRAYTTVKGAIVTAMGKLPLAPDEGGDHGMIPPRTRDEDT
jgi:hypothetical protein